MLVYRVDDYAAAVGTLSVPGARLHELEIPHGPVAVVHGPDDQPVGVYQLTRPEVVDHFDGRFDP